MIFRDQKDVGSDQTQGPRPLSQELLSKQPRIGNGTAVTVGDRVTMNGRGEIDPEPIEMELAHEGGGAADEQLADHLVPEPRCPAARTVVDVAAIRIRPVTRPPLVPIVNVVFRRVGVVGPFRALSIERIMVVDDIENNRHAAAMALAHEMLELVAAAAGKFDGHVVRSAVSP